MEFKNQKIDFSKPLANSDQILTVEGHKFYVHRAMLGLWSPVFATMFSSGFREATQTSIDLPGKKAGVFKEFLLLLYSPYDMHLQSRNNWLNEQTYRSIALILEYIREYQTGKAFHVMEIKLQDYLRKMEDQKPNELHEKLQTCMRLLYLADQYHLDKVKDAVVPLLKYFKQADVVKHFKFKSLSMEMKFKVMSEMACQLETSLQAIIKCTSNCDKCTQEVKQQINEAHYKTHSPPPPPPQVRTLNEEIDNVRSVALSDFDFDL